MKKSLKKSLIKELPDLSDGGPVNDFTVQRDRPKRQQYIPRSFIAAGLIALLFALGVFGYSLYRYMNQPIVVPSVIGKSETTGKAFLKQEGFTNIVTSYKISSLPQDEILAQDPAPQDRLDKDAQITLYVSAGDGLVAIPDIVGKNIKLVTGLLQNLEIPFDVTNVISRESSGTVLSSTPAPGTKIKRNTSISLTVAMDADNLGVLLPFNLEGMVFVIDPAATLATSRDIPLEVANRLQGLLEASGAKVVLTRSALVKPEQFTDASRQKIIEDTNPDLFISLDVRKEDPLGITIQTTPQGAALAEDTAKKVITELQKQSYTVAAVPSEKGSSTSPGLKIILGNINARSDTNRFSSGTFVDTVAKSLYTSIGIASGKPVQGQ